MTTELPLFNEPTAGMNIGNTKHCIAINYGNIGHLVNLATAHKLAQIINTILLKKTECNVQMRIDKQEKYKEEK